MQFIKGPDNTKMPVWVKDPDDIEDYTLGWGKRLADDDEIVSTRFFTDQVGLNIFSWNFTASTATCWTAEGNPGSQYDVVNEITTERGRKHQRTFRLVIANK